MMFYKPNINSFSRLTAYLMYDYIFDVHNVTKFFFNKKDSQVCMNNVNNNKKYLILFVLKYGVDVRNDIFIS